MQILLLIFLSFLNISCNSSSGVFEPGDSSDDSAMVVATEKLTGYSESNNLGAYLNSTKTINDAFALVEIKTYISDVVVNSSGVLSGDTVPEAINKMLAAIDALNVPIERDTVVYNSYLQSDETDIVQELADLLKKSKYDKDIDDTNTALFFLIKEQQKQIQNLKNSLNKLSNKKNNLY